MNSQKIYINEKQSLINTTSRQDTAYDHINQMGDFFARIRFGRVLPPTTATGYFLSFDKKDFQVLHVFNHTRFGYFDFRQKFLKHPSLGPILSKILCRIQIWANKIGLPTG